MAKINADEYFLCNCNCVIVVPSEKPMREDVSTLVYFCQPCMYVANWVDRRHEKLSLILAMLGKAISL